MPVIHTEQPKSARPIAMREITFPEVEPIFVVGTGRSGTTLLQLMLNAHPSIAICGELHYFDEIQHIKRLLPSLDSHHSIEQLHSYIQRTETASRLLDGERIFGAGIERLKQDPSPSYEKFLKYVLEEYAQAEGARRFGEKTPANVRYILDILSIFPNARIVHLIRDPRDVVASRLEMPWASNSLLVHIVKWRAEVCSASDFSDMTENYMELLYEDLIEQPECKLKKICQFLGEEYSDAMLEFHQTAKNYIRSDISFEKTSNPLNSTALGRWKNDLTGPQVFIIQSMLGPAMKVLGYEKARIGLGARLVSLVLFPFELVKAIGLAVGYGFRNLTSRRIIRSEHKRLYRMIFPLWSPKQFPRRPT